MERDYFEGAARVYVIDGTDGTPTLESFDVKPWGTSAFVNVSGGRKSFGAVGGYATRPDVGDLWRRGFRLTAAEAIEAFREKQGRKIAEAQREIEEAREALAELTLIAED